MASAAGAGLVFGLSLIVAIGPQNAYVLRQGLRRQHVTAVVVVCSVSDVVLIALGVSGAGAVFDGRHWLLVASTVLGACFLVGYAGTAVLRAIRSSSTLDEAAARPATRRGVLVTCLAFTWLNPAVYVDTVFLIAPLSRTHAPEQWWFALGAMVASVTWFAGLGYGARGLSRLFARPAAWRAVDAVIAAIMLATAARLVLDM